MTENKFEKYEKTYWKLWNKDRKIVSLIDEKKPDLSILDLGCGFGKLDYHFKKRGAYVFGVEQNEERVKVAELVVDELYKGSFLENEFLNKLTKKFDYILFIDVLEHQTEPEKILKIFESKLKPNGYFIMSVPNIAYWTMRLKLLFGKWEYEEVGMLNYTHYRFYTADSLKKFIKNHGYELINFFIIKDDSKFFLRKFIVSILFFFFPRLFGNSLLSVFKPLQEPIGK